MKRASICVLDIGDGNVDAFVNCLQQLSASFEIINSPQTGYVPTHVILPGVGSFDRFIGALKSRGFDDWLEGLSADHGTWILGVCIGMHVMASSSEEGEMNGLDKVFGRVRRLNANVIRPHMGWSAVQPRGELGKQLFRGIDCEEGFYFLHNYWFDPDCESSVIATVNYGGQFAVAVHRDRYVGVQFHPEKSHENGLKLIQNFIELC